MLAAKAGATYISPFLGRVDDISGDGMELLEQIIAIYRNYDMDTQVLAASIRHPLHVVQAALLGSDVATLPHKSNLGRGTHPETEGRAREEPNRQAKRRGRRNSQTPKEEADPQFFREEADTQLFMTRAWRRHR